VILGIQILPIYLVFGGLTTLTCLIVQILIGLRVIHFKGARHFAIHKTFGFVLLAIAAVHATTGLTFAFGWRVLS
jgi:hypothetical protein